VFDLNFYLRFRGALLFFFISPDVFFFCLKKFDLDCSTSPILFIYILLLSIKINLSTSVVEDADDDDQREEIRRRIEDEISNSFIYLIL
jgi:hypothetical protein